METEKKLIKEYKKLFNKLMQESQKCPDAFKAIELGEQAMEYQRKYHALLDQVFIYEQKAL